MQFYNLIKIKFLTQQTKQFYLNISFFKLNYEFSKLFGHRLHF